MHSRILVLDDTTPEVEVADYIQDSPSKHFWDSMNEDVQAMLPITPQNRYAIQSRICMEHGFYIAYDGNTFSLPGFVQFFGDNEFEIKKFLDYHF